MLPLPPNNPGGTSRRKFIVKCSSLATVLAAPAALARGIQRGPRDHLSLDALKYSHFAPFVGSRFDVCQGLLRIKLHLVEASFDPNHVSAPIAGNHEPEQFSLIFHGVESQPLDQNSYQFAHNNLGRFMMFIVPIGAPDQAAVGRFYEAVFNRPAHLATTAMIYG